MSAKLTLRYEFSSDDDDFGWLAAAVETGRFSGKGGFWVQWQDVEEWAARLSAYPFSADNPCVEEWGQCKGDGSNYAVIIGVSILPANRTGDLDVLVRIGDCHDARQYCQAVFRTNYPETERFAAEIQAMMRREAEAATLFGRNMP